MLRLCCFLLVVFSTACNPFKGLNKAINGDSDDMGIYDTSIAANPFALKWSVNEGIDAFLKVEICDKAREKCDELALMRCRKDSCVMDRYSGKDDYKFEWKNDGVGYRDIKIWFPQETVWERITPAELHEHYEFQVRIEKSGAEPGAWTLIGKSGK